jgi:hypothetical protein
MFTLLFTPFLRASSAALLVETACAIVAVGATATALGRMAVIHQRLRRLENPRELEGGGSPRPVPAARPAPGRRST